MNIARKSILLALLMWFGVFLFAEHALADESYIELWGIVQSAPFAANGNGKWTILTEDGTQYSITASADTHFMHGVPSIGQTIFLNGVIANDNTILAYHIVYWALPASEQPLLNAVWTSLFGEVTNVPGSADGTGLWEIIDEETVQHRIYIVDSAILGGEMPTAGQNVLVEGFELPNGEISAATFTLYSSGSEPAPAPSMLVAFRGQVTLAPTPVNSVTWLIEATHEGTEATYPILVEPETAFYPAMPTVGDWVHVVALGYEADSGSTQYEAVEIALDTFVAGEIVARLSTGVISSTIAARYNLIPQETLLASGDIHRFFSADPTGRYLTSMIEQMALDPEITWVEFNQIGSVPLEGDPHSTWGWGGADSESYVNGKVLQQINLVHAHDQVRGGDVVIAVLDTGVDINHPALQGRLLPGWDMIDDDEVPLDEGGGVARGHGTHVTGIAARIAPESRILPVRVLDSSGRGDMFVLAYAIEWAVHNGADVVNLSLGSAVNSRVLSEVIVEAMAQDVVVVAAAGNDNSNEPRYPAAQPGVLGVTAVDQNGIKASFANYGPWVSIAAPGVGITSTIVGPQGSGYAAWSGTSMATPFVSGASALIRQHDPALSAVQIGAKLIRYSSPASEDELPQSYSLGGLLNVDDALALTEIVRSLYMPVVWRE